MSVPTIPDATDPTHHIDPQRVAELDERFDAIWRGEPDPPSETVLRAVDALKNAMHWMLTAHPSDDDAARLTAAVQPVLDGHTTHSATTRYREQDLSTGMSLSHAPISPNARGRHPLIGRGSPMAPPIRMGHDGTTIHGYVNYDARFEGLPGCVHGGFIAAGFDIVCGQAMSMLGRGGPTGSLTVRYRQLTPIGVALRYESWLSKVDGRKLHMAARLVVVETEVVTAVGETIFVQRRDPDAFPRPGEAAARAGVGGDASA